MSSVGNPSDSPVPPQLRSAVLDELHEGHPGIEELCSELCVVAGTGWRLGGSGSEVH